ncbi:hypothetical protein AWENTII_003451 [Aspergillus wentii]|nr:hypothetical protein MW887_011892 [Aspergillus wentii]
MSNRRRLHDPPVTIAAKPVVSQSSDSSSQEKVAIPRIHKDSSEIRRRNANACENCRNRKVKCDGYGLVCNNCLQFNLPCVHVESKRERDQKKIMDMSKKIKGYETLLNEAVLEVGDETASRIRDALSASKPLSLQEQTKRDAEIVVESLSEHLFAGEDEDRSARTEPTDLFSRGNRDTDMTYDTSADNASEMPSSDMPTNNQKLESPLGIANCHLSDPTGPVLNSTNTYPLASSSASNALEKSDNSVFSNGRFEEAWSRVSSSVQNYLELSGPQQVPGPLPMCSPKDLPPEEDTRAGATAFFSNTSALFYVMTPEEFDDLLQRVYRSESPVDVVTLCEMCSLASVGSQYLPEQPLEDVKKTLFSTAIVHLDQCIKVDPVRALRILVCLSAYHIIEHHNVAHASIVSGLGLARKLGSQIAKHSDQSLIIRKTYRTLIFMECWLSTSLGYPPALGDTEHTFINESIKCELELSNGDLAVQEQAGLVALLKSDILKGLYSSTSSENEIEVHVGKLEGWYSTLPQEMRLLALLSNEATPLPLAQQRGLLFLHLIYLGAIMLLYRRTLSMAFANQLQSPTTMHSFPEGVSDYYDRAVMAAHQVARIFLLIDYEKNVYRRCWLCISEIYSASTILLFSASYKILYNHAGAEDDLEHAESLVNMLKCASSVDYVAKNLADLLGPILYETHYLYNYSQREKSDSYKHSWFEESCRSNTLKSLNLLFEVFGEDRKVHLENIREPGEKLPTWWE